MKVKFIILMQSQIQPLIAEFKNLSLNPSLVHQIDKFLISQYKLQQLPELVSAIMNGDIIQQHYGVIGIRKLLSDPDEPPIKQVVDAKLVPKCMQMIRQQNHPHLQFEATWILTNVTSSQSIPCQMIIDLNWIPVIVNLLNSKTAQIMQQAIWLISNLAGDNIGFRDSIIKSGGLKYLVQIFDSNNDQKVIKVCSWALCNLCKGEPKPSYHLVKAGISALCRAIANGKIVKQYDLIECCQAIVDHSTTQNEIKIVMNTNIVPRLIYLLQTHNAQLLAQIIRILGNISTGEDQYSNILVNAGLLESVQKLFNRKQMAIRKEVCWLLSNVVSVNKVIMKKQSLLTKLLKLFENDKIQVKKEIVFIFRNLILNGEPSSIFTLYQNAQIIKYYITMLKSQDENILLATLQCFDNFCNFGSKFVLEGKNFFLLQIEKYQGINVIENLQCHKSAKVYEAVVKFSKDYFQTQ